MSRAVILAAGRGSRMAAPDETVALAPDQIAAADAGNKAMIPVGRPFLDYALSGLGDAGFTDICIVVSPNDFAIRDRYTHGIVPARFNLSFAVQSVPTGTADAVLAAEKFTATEPFVVVNSDNYYPPEVLESLRHASGAACIGFSRDTLIQGGNISGERIGAYAILDVGADRYLRGLVEKPGAAAVQSMGGDVEVSMNCWRFTSDIFRACREVSPSARHERELPLAVQYAIEVLGMRVQVIHAEAAVLDLSRRADVPGVALKLKGVRVTL